MLPDSHRSGSSPSPPGLEASCSLGPMQSCPASPGCSRSHKSRHRAAVFTGIFLSRPGSPGHRDSMVFANVTDEAGVWQPALALSAGLFRFSVCRLPANVNKVCRHSRIHSVCGSLFITARQLLLLMEVGSNRTVRCEGREGSCVLRLQKGLVYNYGCSRTQNS